MKSLEDPKAVQESLSAALDHGHLPEKGVDYRLVGSMSQSFVGLSHSGRPALVLPLEEAPASVGRAAAGFRLTSVSLVTFSDEGRRWSMPAAILECLEPSALFSFSAFACDVAARAGSKLEGNDWKAILRIVEEWYSLLARRQRLSVETEVGMWGELWFMLQSAAVDSLIAAWMGPAGGVVDFMLGSIAVDVKTSRAKGRHHVSQTQVVRPMGDTPAYLLSLWIGADPEAGESLATLVDRLRATTTDPIETARRLLATGFAEGDREEYQTPFRVLEEPAWYSIEVVPRVREADAGVSNLRYVVDLSGIAACSAVEAGHLCQHFLGRDHWTI